MSGKTGDLKWQNIETVTESCIHLVSRRKKKALNERSYVGVLKRDEKTIKLIFEPNERIVNALKRYAPRKFEARA